jgi:hypothetical protein
MDLRQLLPLGREVFVDDRPMLACESDGDLRPVSPSVTAVRRIEPLEVPHPLVAHRRKDLMWP